jgi:hypothetical protein
VEHEIFGIFGIQGIQSMVGEAINPMQCQLP